MSRRKAQYVQVWSRGGTETCRLVDRFYVEADGARFEMIVHKPTKNDDGRDLKMSEFTTGYGVGWTRCGPESKYNREVGRAAWDGLVAKYGAAKVREVITHGIGHYPRLNGEAEAAA